jgi:hypothetical protein
MKVLRVFAQSQRERPTSQTATVTEMEPLCLRRFAPGSGTVIADRRPTLRPWAPLAVGQLGTSTPGARCFTRFILTKS